MFIVWIYYEQFVNSFKDKKIGYLWYKIHCFMLRKYKNLYCILDRKLCILERKLQKKGGAMQGIFKKLIRKEFGQKKYNAYIETIYQNLENRTLGCKELYKDIYEYCQQKDARTLSNMRKHLNEAVHSVMLICKNYTIVLLFYLFALLFLLGEGLQESVTWGAGALITIAFLVKTYEYVVNKFCFMDAQIIMIYKEVLDKMEGKYRDGMAGK